MSSREAIVSLRLPEQKECFFPSLEDLADDGILFSLMTVQYTCLLITDEPRAVLSDQSGLSLSSMIG